MSNLLLALLLTGCQGPMNDGQENPGNDIDNPNTEDSAGMDPVTAQVASEINFASWNDDMTEVIDNVQSVEGIEFLIEDRFIDPKYDVSLTGTTIGSVDLFAGTYDTTFTGNLNGVTYLGSVTTDVAADTIIAGALCVDVTGDWTCQNEYEGEQYEPYDVRIDVQSNCKVETDMNDEDEVNGHHWISENLDGIVSTNGLEIKLNHYGNSGTWYGVDTCVKH